MKGGGAWLGSHRSHGERGDAPMGMKEDAITRHRTDIPLPSPPPYSSPGL